MRELRCAVCSPRNKVALSQNCLFLINLKIRSLPNGSEWWKELSPNIPLRYQPIKGFFFSFFFLFHWGVIDLEPRTAQGYTAEWPDWHKLKMFYSYFRAHTIIIHCGSEVTICCDFCFWESLFFVQSTFSALLKCMFHASVLGISCRLDLHIARLALSRKSTCSMDLPASK